MSTLLDQIEIKLGASEEAIKAMVARIGVEPPGDYLDFLRLTNGGHGTGPDIFVILFGAEEVGTPGFDYAAPEFASGLIVIGGDGCGNILGIDATKSDRRLQQYVVLDPVEMNLNSVSVQFRGTTFSGMLQHLSRYGDEE
jgi:SMI1 / KNR4 family (SUKH-1)